MMRADCAVRPPLLLRLRGRCGRQHVRRGRRPRSTHPADVGATETYLNTTLAVPDPPNVRQLEENLALCAKEAAAANLRSILRCIRATETMAETMLADLRARAARACWCKCTGCTTRNVPLTTNQYISLVVQPVHSHQHARAARARKSASMVSASMISVLPRMYMPVYGLYGWVARDSGSPASRRGRDKRGFHRRANDSYILVYFAFSAYMLPNFVIFIIFCNILSFFDDIFQ